MYENNKDIGWKKKNNSSNGSYDDSLIKNQINILDNKIDEEIEEVDTQLAHIKKFITPEEFGAIGDGITDDTLAIQTALKELNNGYKVIFEQSKVYKITSPIITELTTKVVEVDFNFSKIILGKPQRYFNGLIAFNFDKTLRDTVLNLRNGNFDLSINTPDFSPNSIESNLLGGAGVIKTVGARNVHIENCNFNDVFFSSAIHIMYADTISISYCNGVNIGGMASKSADDRAGDAIYTAKLGVYGDSSTLVGGDDLLNNEVSVNISNCNFKSYEAVECETFTPINCNHSGRCGVVVGEYSTNLKKKNIIIRNSFFENYQRTIHIEYTKSWNVLVENCKIYNYGDALLISHDNTWDSIMFRNVEFKKDIKIRSMLIASEGHVAYTSSNSEYKKTNNMIFDNCLFMGKGQLIRNFYTTNVKFENCIFELDTLYANNSNLYINNSNIKFNSGDLNDCVFNFSNSTIEGGYLNDEDSNYCLCDPSEVVGRDNLCFVTNSTLKNCAIGTDNIIRIENNRFILDENFKPKTTLNVNKNLIPSFNNCYFLNNTVTNNSSKAVGLLSYNLQKGRKVVIENNHFSNCNISILDGFNHDLECNNNYFFTDSGIISKFINVYRNKAKITNNKFEGLSSGEFSSNGIVENNYRVTTDDYIEI